MSYSLESDLDMLGMDDDGPERPDIIPIKLKQRGETKMYSPSMVKPLMIESLQDYIDHGTPKGGFLAAVLSNDLCEAAARADEENFDNLAHLVGWCYNNVPLEAWKSKENYIRWIKAHEQVRNRMGYGKYSLNEVYTEIYRMVEA